MRRVDSVKPHIVKFRGIWYCYGASEKGMGFTPKTAYEDFLRQYFTRKYA